MLAYGAKHYLAILPGPGTDIGISHYEYPASTIHPAQPPFSAGSGAGEPVRRGLYGIKACALNRSLIYNPTAFLNGYPGNVSKIHNQDSVPPCQDSLCPTNICFFWRNRCTKSLKALDQNIVLLFLQLKGPSNYRIMPSQSSKLNRRSRLLSQ